MNDPLQDLFSGIREACSPRAWSRGIELARTDAVDATADGDPLELRVRTPGRTVAPIVTFYLEDGEWGCSCDTTEDACEHAAAAIIALRQAKKDGRALPTSKKARAVVGYRLSRDGDRIAVGRMAVHDGSEQRIDVSIASILSGREHGPAIDPTQIDLTIDQFLQQSRVRSLPAERFLLLVPLLSQAPDVRIDGQPVKVEEEPVWPRVAIESRGRGFALLFERPADELEVVAPGVALVRSETLALRPIGATEIVGNKLERLPCEEIYRDERVAELVTRVLPTWRERTRVDERARLPDAKGELKVWPLVEVTQHGTTLRISAAIAYGDPPLARVTGDGLLRAPGALVPVIARNERRERTVIEALRAQLDLAPGKTVELSGRDAVAMAKKLRELEGFAIFGDAHRAHYAGDLVASVRGDGTRFEVSFGAEVAGQPRSADATAVLEAWQRGDSVVPLMGGGWATIPIDWLERFGHRIRELLSAREQGERLAAHSRPALAQLLCDLEQPLPPDLARLAPLARELSGIPEATLPNDLAATLRPYQRAGVNWLCFLRGVELGALLADDMGLGKTLQTLCALDGPPMHTRALVVCPRSVVHNWVDEIHRFRPGLSVQVYHGPDRQLGEGIVVTTYALLRRDVELLASIRWDGVVLDEAQTIKNPDSQIAQAAYRLQASQRIALSGTPIENRLEELWSLMHFCNRGLLGGRSAFRDSYERPITNGDAGAAARLRSRIRPFVLRRTKAEVAADLPPRTEAVLACELEPAERQIYDAIHLATKSSVLKALEQQGNVMAALEALLRLRQAACDVALVPGHGGDGTKEASSKIQRLLLALEDAVADGHKSLVFSQWTSLLDRIEPELRRAGIGWSRLDGSTTNREEVVKRFQGNDGPPVMLLSLKAGGTGLNLTAADHVFLLDPWWNPAAEDQAADRAHRIGQERPVIVYRLVAKDTVEERIMELQKKKRALAEVALDDATAAATLTKDDLLALLA